jgi:hypothetical protein
VRLAEEGSGAVIHVEVSPGRLAQLNLRAGDTVQVSPQRVRVFVPDYVI